MVENLGAFLHRKEDEHKVHLKFVEENVNRREAERAQKAMDAARQYLDELRVKIVDDAKAGRNWSSSLRGMIYVVPERDPKQLWKAEIQTFRQPGGFRSYGYRYVHDEKLWMEFVAWAKDHGLTCTLEEEGHTETNGGDEGWHEHDYYYILLRPLE